MMAAGRRAALLFFDYHGGRSPGAPTQEVTLSRRRRHAAVICMFALTLVIAACSKSTAQERVVAPSMTSAAPTTAVPVKTPPPPVGASSGALAGLPSGQLDRELDVARTVGATWIRIDIDWSVIEPTKGVFDWTSTDRAVQAARSHGLAVLGIVDYTPAWARDPSVPSGTAHGRPASPELFGTFAGQAAEHYAGQIDAWEIWNEPNLRLFFRPQPDVAYYTQLLRASYQAIHAVSQSVPVIAGSLAPAVDEPDGSDISPPTFVAQMYAAGAKDSLDAVSIHPYGYPALPSDARTAAYNSFFQIPYVHATMQRYGDGAKLVWLTEFGAPTATVSTGTGPVTIDDQRQAAIIADGLHVAAQLGYIGPVFIYSIRDEKTGNPDILKNFGIVRSDFSRKPSFEVIQQYTQTR